MQAGNYLQQKYPIENPFLKSMAGLYPNSCQMSQTHGKLISLKSFFKPFISIPFINPHGQVEQKSTHIVPL